eukprot:TRINITY_DN65137_c0_g1_i1.p1 TRINITY_DN65137_c0_g1~~TRINITY_DN65137_c0_g1_i1.p1  ORF type:complete len:626 (+),score=100.85 TRINITY_DN65137_c0_g1_i1:62-1879(+)
MALPPSGGEAWGGARGAACPAPRCSRPPSCELLIVGPNIQGSQNNPVDSPESPPPASHGTAPQQPAPAAPHCANGISAAPPRPSVTVPADEPFWKRWWTPQLRGDINDLFDEPSTSNWAKLVATFFLLVILASTAAFMAETVPKLSGEPPHGDPEDKDRWFIAETVFVSLFTFEYVARFATDRDPQRFVYQPTNVIDLLAILPYFLELALSEAAGDTDKLNILRILRLARVFRVLKLGKSFGGTEVLTDCMKKSIPALSVPFFMVMIADVIFASLINLVERGTWKDCNGTCDGAYYVEDSVYGEEVPSEFVSVPECMWWAIVTMTTVGYGDHSPNTGAGKAVAVVCMMVGVLFMAMPIAVIGNNFYASWNAYVERKQAKSKASVASVVHSPRPVPAPSGLPRLNGNFDLSQVSPRASESGDPLAAVAVPLETALSARSQSLRRILVTATVEHRTSGQWLAVLRLHGTCRCAALAKPLAPLVWHCDKAAGVCATAVQLDPSADQVHVPASPATPSLWPEARRRPRVRQGAEYGDLEGAAAATLSDGAARLALLVIDYLIDGQGFALEAMGSPSCMDGSHRGLPCAYSAVLTQPSRADPAQDLPENP